VIQLSRLIYFEDSNVDQRTSVIQGLSTDLGNLIK